MMAVKWEKVIQKQGLHFASVIDAKLAKFNKDKTEGFGVVDHEIDFIKAHPYQAKEYNDLLAAHWQNFKLPESAAPPKRFAFQDLSPDTKVRRCEKTNELFMKIFCEAVRGRSILWTLMRVTFHRLHDRWAGEMNAASIANASGANWKSVMTSW